MQDGSGVEDCLEKGCAAGLPSWVSCCFMKDIAGSKFHVLNLLPIKKMLLSTDIWHAVSAYCCYLTLRKKCYLVVIWSDLGFERLSGLLY